MPCAVCMVCIWPSHPGSGKATKSRTAFTEATACSSRACVSSAALASAAGTVICVCACVRVCIPCGSEG